ncbi:DUF2529 family protein [Alteribacter populi]|uniref:DUF2529 family protein n=1 Tax=Alteribacter populi TaxID=2011011 RepID=UPI000BBB0D21|nr:DUF2529 family protein [Alteribacter populi]
MQKIFATQLQGLINQLHKSEEETIEDGGRLIAQSIVSGGRIGLYGTGDMAGILVQGIRGVDRFENALIIEESDLESLDELDTVILFSPSPHEATTCMVADSLREQQIQTVAVFTGEKRDEGPSLEDLTDVAIDLGVDRGLIPGEDGERIGQPRLLMALYAYYALYFTTKEILDEHR